MSLPSVHTAPAFRVDDVDRAFRAVLDDDDRISWEALRAEKAEAVTRKRDQRARIRWIGSSMVKDSVGYDRIVSLG